MVDQWWYRLFDEEFGPVPFELLVELARNGTLQNEDRVRNGGDVEWMTAESIPGLLKQPALPTQTENALERTMPTPGAAAPADEPLPGASSAALDILSRFVDRGSQPTSNEVTGRQRLAFNPSVRASSGAAAPSADSRVIAKRSDPAFSLSSRSLRALIRWAAAIAVIVGIPVIAFWRYGKTEHVSVAKTHELYSGIWQEMKGLRARSASEAEWNELTERVRVQVAPVVKQLERTAGSDHHELQCLLWAGRDCLPRMLDDARIEPSQSEQEFAEHMKLAAAILRREDPIDAPRVRGQKSQNQRGISTTLQKFLIAVLVVADAGFVLLLFDVLRKRRQ